MVRIPQSYVRAGFAGLSGSGRMRDPWVRPIISPPDHLYNRLVTVDLGNDGIAPNAVFTAAGKAQASVGPFSSGEKWSLKHCYLSTSVGQLDAAQCQVFVGPLPIQQYAVTGSLSGGASQFGLGGSSIEYGWFVYAVWTGGTSGAVGNLRVTGSKTVLTN